MRKFIFYKLSTSKKHCVCNKPLNKSLSNCTLKSRIIYANVESTLNQVCYFGLFKVLFSLHHICVLHTCVTMTQSKTCLPSAHYIILIHSPFPLIFLHICEFPGPVSLSKFKCWPNMKNSVNDTDNLIFGLDVL